jgi:3-keto-5-aminohexanoate cleavage enzyme
MRRIIVSLAPVPTASIPGVIAPLTPEEVARDVVAAARAGAAVAHLHVRDRSGAPTDDLSAFSRTLGLIRAGSDIIIQGSTGGLSTLSLEQRCVAVDDPRVETASLNMGSANMNDSVYVNTLPDIRYWAGRMRDRGVRPELEIFEAGMVHNVALLAAEGRLEPPFIYGLCLGFRGALPAQPRALAMLVSLLPPEAIWGLIHHGMEDLSLLATAIGLGASFIRVGYEDSAHYAPERAASSNVLLVEKAVDLIHAMGLAVATPLEARGILGLIHGKGI